MMQAPLIKQKRLRGGMEGLQGLIPEIWVWLKIWHIGYMALNRALNLSKYARPSVERFAYLQGSCEG